MDEAICRWVVQSGAYEKARTIFCYMGTAREIDTMRLIHIMMRDGKKVAVPLCVAAGVMEARRIEGMGDLVSGEYGIWFVLARRIKINGSMQKKTFGNMITVRLDGSR